MKTPAVPSRAVTMGAAEFKAKCLDVFARISDGSLARVVVTKRGKPVAVVSAAEPSPAAAESLFGCMKGSVIVPPDLDLTAPTADLADFDAARGVLFNA